MRTLFTLFLLIQLNLGFGQEQFDFSAVAKFQKELNAEYADAKTSSLTAEDLAVFKTLNFYPANETFMWWQNL